MNFSLRNLSNFHQHLQNEIKWTTFSSKIVIIRFWDNSDQEMNFKSYLNSLLLCEKGKIMSDFHFLCLILFTFVLTFAMKLEDNNYKSHWKNSAFWVQWKMMPDLNMLQEKMSDFVSFSLFGFNLVMKLKNLGFENHWNIVIFLLKNIVLQVWIYSTKRVWFRFISIASIYFSHKTGKFRFWKPLSHWNTLTFFIKKMAWDLDIFHG